MPATTNGVLAIVLASFEDLANSNRRLVVGSPEGFVWDQGVEEKIINQRSDFGEIYLAEAVATGKSPFVTLTYGTLTKELLALKTGYALAEQADVGLFLKSLQVKQASYPAVVTGQDGFGMLADQTTSAASVLRNGISVPLTRQPFATFTDATASSFAQGENGAIKFSSDIVAAREFVTVDFQYPVTGAQVLSEDPFDTFILRLVGILNDKSVFNIVFDPVQLNRSENNEIDFSADNFPFQFRVTDPACVPRLKFLNRRRAC